MSDVFLFTSESVTEGHPDKLCDLISDSILDACIAQDPNSSVACEVIAKTGFVMLIGEITTQSDVDLRVVARETIAKVGYLSSKQYFDATLCHVGVLVGQQSADISKSLTNGGAGDQGIFFGYATDENPERMPTTLLLAHRLAERLTEVRKERIIPGLGPDGKTQVSMEYKEENGAMVPIRVHTVVISTMHEKSIDLENLRQEIIEKVIKTVIPSRFLDSKTCMLINPGGRFVIGGPAGDAGLTGRKVIIDSYGGWGSNGGGALSGKDPSKIDRAASYAARWIAKSIVDSNLARRCLIQLSYGFSLEHPISIHIDTYGTGAVSDTQLLDIIKARFDLRPMSIVQQLDLKRPIYHKTAVYGHFGRNDPDFTWENSVHLTI